MEAEYSKILVTGGAGFIGSHLVERLLREGFEVRVVDNLRTGRMENIIHHTSRSDFHFIRGDILNCTLLKKVMKDIEVVYHQAAVASVPFSIKDPLLTNAINVQGTLNLLKTCIDAGTKRFVFASSAAIYGKTDVIATESMIPRPTSPYGVSKLASEKYMEVFQSLYGLDPICLRYFNVYGPRQVNGGVISIFINQILDNQAPTIEGDGEQTRDFVNVKDIVEANILALRKKVTGVFNIASGRCITINQLAKLIGELADKDIQPKYLNPRPGDPKEGGADIRKARELLDFRPQVSLRKGLLELLARANMPI
jgi:UDP-glucose 4-epimerase